LISRPCSTMGYYASGFVVRRGAEFGLGVFLGVIFGHRDGIGLIFPFRPVHWLTNDNTNVTSASEVGIFMWFKCACASAASGDAIPTRVTTFLPVCDVETPPRPPSRRGRLSFRVDARRHEKPTAYLSWPNCLRPVNHVARSYISQRKQITAVRAVFRHSRPFPVGLGRMSVGSPVQA